MDLEQYLKIEFILITLSVLNLLEKLPKDMEVKIGVYCELKEGWFSAEEDIVNTYCTQDGETYFLNCEIYED